MTRIDVNNGFANSVQSVTEKVAQSVERYEQDKDMFLKLLMAQLTNQDPTKPLETNELSGQIISMGAVEQQINTNKLLTELLAANQHNKLDNTSSYIGRQVEFDYSEVEIIPGYSNKIIYNLAEDVVKSKIEIVNKKGEVVHTIKGGTGKGSHEVYWDGKDKDKKKVAADTYRIQITAINADGLPISANSIAKGVVNSVKVTNGEIMLALDTGQELRLDKVMGIYNVSKEDLNAYLGKMVEFDNSKAKWDGESNVEFNFNLSQARKNTFANIYNSTGEIVYTKSFPNVDSGINKIVWNGQNNKNILQPPGVYRLSVVDQNNKPIPNTTTARGKVTSIGKGDDSNPTLTINDHVVITSKDIISVVNNNDNLEQLRAYANSL